MSVDAKPPAWAETLLRVILPRQHRDSVSGDLLEEYRERVLPALGAAGADAWYVRQMLGFVWRATWVWAVLMAAGVLIRSAFDQFDPPQSFYLRSVISTNWAVVIFALAGFTAGRRSQSRRGGRARVDEFGDGLVAGAVNGFVVGLVAAVLEIAGAAAMLAVWHDPQTLDAIARSGGLGEVFVLPFVHIVPGTILAEFGGIVGMLSTTTRRLDVI